MPLAKDRARMTAEEYLEWEKGNETKHEYVNGEIFPLHGETYGLAGAKDSHVTVAGNAFALLRAHLRGGDCRTYISDMKLSVEQDNVFFYPDVLVTCDARDKENQYYKQFPLLIIEVLSESTAAFDRGNKFSSYRKVGTLREYVLIDPDRITIDCFRFDEATGHWVLYPYAAGEVVELASIGFSAPIEVFYENVELATPAA